MRILVTGGCGFIGSHFIEDYIDHKDVECIINLDMMTCVANKNLPFEKNKKYQHLKIDISNHEILSSLIEFKIDHIVHFAAESHVDNSIFDSVPFINSNIIGTHNILLDLLRYKNDYNGSFKFVHVSTDEVFGSLNNKEGGFTEESPYKPNSPYAASKAASDLLVRSFVKTYKLPAMITNCSNNFGSRQYPEKLIPVCITKLKNKEPIPLYGSGNNVRDWIYVKDHVKALWSVLTNGKIGSQYLIGGDNEISNYDLIHIIKDLYKNITDIDPEGWQWFENVEDRKGHDLRYAIDILDFKLAFRDFKLSPFNESMKTTVSSYLN